MANIQSEDIAFSDLGKYRNKECMKIGKSIVCEVKFSKGRVFIMREELRKLCENSKIMEDI